MTIPADPFIFPSDDSLCERCGYPIKGLSIDASCPECGSAVAESSPDKRYMTFDSALHGLVQYIRIAPKLFLRPSAIFRAIRIDGDMLTPYRFLFWSASIAAVIWTAILCLGGLWQATIRWQGYTVSQLIMNYFAVVLSVYTLTYIEMLGVTAFSKRRGWRVPFQLARRVCCYASVAWLPGVLIAAIGFGLLQEHGVGQMWFEQLVGLVRVGWILYAGLFVFSLLWFETLVWIGVRQVRYANAWPERAILPDAALPDDAPER